MNNYYISTKDPSLGYDTTHYWNRRNQRFQSYLSTACIYPTLTGVKRILYSRFKHYSSICYYSLDSFEYSILKDC